MIFAFPVMYTIFHHSLEKYKYWVILYVMFTVSIKFSSENYQVSHLHYYSKTQS
jgi:hypothetical protein